VVRRLRKRYRALLREAIAAMLDEPDPSDTKFLSALGAGSLTSRRGRSSSD
jgi:hypothetical protein